MNAPTVHLPQWASDVHRPVLAHHPRYGYAQPYSVLRKPQRPGSV